MIYFRTIGQMVTFNSQMPSLCFFVDLCFVLPIAELEFHYRRLRVMRRIRKFAKSDNWIRHVRPSAWKNSAPTGRIFMKFYIWVFFENLSRKFKFH